MRCIAVWIACAFLCSPVFSGEHLLARAAGPDQMPDKEAMKKRASEVVEGRTLYEWSGDLKDRDPSVREVAVAMIKAYGPAARQYAPDVIKTITDSSDISLKVNAVISLGYIGMDEKDLDRGVNALIGCMRHSQGIVRYQAALAISNLGDNLGQNVGAAIQSLAGLLRDQMAWETRGAAAMALRTAGWSKQKGADQTAYNALIGGGYERSGLSDSCAEVRLQCIFSLIVLGTPMNPSTKARELQAFRVLAHEKQPDRIGIWARVGIMRIEDKVSEEHLVVIAKYLRHSNAPTRVHAARALGTIGPKAQSRVPDLIEALDDKDPGVLIWTCNALEMIGNAASAAIPKLEKLAKEHPDPRVRDSAKKAIEKISTKLRSSIDRSSKGR